jgi:hypothetical protein
MRRDKLQSNHNMYSQDSKVALQLARQSIQLFNHYFIFVINVIHL